MRKLQWSPFLVPQCSPFRSGCSTFRRLPHKINLLFLWCQRGRFSNQGPNPKASRLSCRGCRFLTIFVFDRESCSRVCSWAEPPYHRTSPCIFFQSPRRNGGLLWMFLLHLYSRFRALCSSKTPRWSLPSRCCRQWPMNWWCSSLKLKFHTWQYGFSISYRCLKEVQGWWGILQGLKWRYAWLLGWIRSWVSRLHGLFHRWSSTFSSKTR